MDVIPAPEAPFGFIYAGTLVVFFALLAFQAYRLQKARKALSKCRIKIVQSILKEWCQELDVRVVVLRDVDPEEVRVQIKRRDSGAVIEEFFWQEDRPLLTRLARLDFGPRIRTYPRLREHLDTTGSQRLARDFVRGFVRAWSKGKYRWEAEGEGSHTMKVWLTPKNEDSSEEVVIDWSKEGFPSILQLIDAMSRVDAKLLGSPEGPSLWDHLESL